MRECVHVNVHVWQRESDHLADERASAGEEEGGNTWFSDLDLPPGELPRVRAGGRTNGGGGKKRRGGKAKPQAARLTQYDDDDVRQAADDLHRGSFRILRRMNTHARSSTLMHMHMHPRTAQICPDIL